MLVFPDVLVVLGGFMPWWFLQQPLSKNPQLPGPGGWIIPRMDFLVVIRITPHLLSHDLSAIWNGSFKTRSLGDLLINGY